MLRYVSFAIVILFGCLVNFLLIRPVLGKPAVDFAQFYFAGELISEGKLAQIYQPEVYKPLVERVAATGEELRPFVYFNRPAFSAPLYWAYSLLPYVASSRVFLGLNFAVWGFLIWKLPIWLGAPAFLRIWMFSMFPLGYAVAVGQDTLGLTVIAAYSLCVLIHRNEIAAGMLLGLCLIKPHLLTFMPVLFLVERKYRALFSFLATGFVLAGVSLAFVGISGIEEWIQLLSAPTTDYHPEVMGTIRALGLKFGTYAALAAAAVAIPAGILVFMHGDYRERLSVAIILALLTSPHAYWGDYTLLTIVGIISTNRIIRYAVLLPWAFFVPGIWPMVLACIGFLVLMTLDSVNRTSENPFGQGLTRKFTRYAEKVSGTAT